jgi:hypothetical protein
MNRSVCPFACVVALLLPLTLPSIGRTQTPTPTPPLYGVPATINIAGQASLVAGGLVPDGSYNFTFRFYDAPTGGNKLAEQIVSSVAVSNGVFNAEVPITDPNVLFNKPNVYVSVDFNGQGESSTRQRYNSVGFTLRSGDVAYNRVVNVVSAVRAGASSGTFSSVAAAIAYINDPNEFSPPPSDTSPVVIRVFPGVYTETTSLKLPRGVSLISEGFPQAIVVANGSTLTSSGTPYGIGLADYCAILDLTVQRTVAGGTAIDLLPANANCTSGTAAAISCVQRIRNTRVQVAAGDMGLQVDTGLGTTFFGRTEDSGIGPFPADANSPTNTTTAVKITSGSRASFRDSLLNGGLSGIGIDGASMNILQGTVTGGTAISVPTPGASTELNIDIHDATVSGSRNDPNTAYGLFVAGGAFDPNDANVLIVNSSINANNVGAGTATAISWGANSAALDALLRIDDSRVFGQTTALDLYPNSPGSLTGNHFRFSNDKFSVANSSTDSLIKTNGTFDILFDGSTFLQGKFTFSVAHGGTSGPPTQLYLSCRACQVEGANTALVDSDANSTSARLVFGASDLRDCHVSSGFGGTAVSFQSYNTKFDGTNVPNLPGSITEGALPAKTVALASGCNAVGP